MFWFKENTFLGIDVGNSSIKIVELKVQNNTPVLSNYAWMDLGQAKNLNMEKIQELCLKKIIKEGKIGGKNVYISIPSPGSLIVLFELPEMDKKDLDQAVKFEAHKYIPVSSMEDVVISWDVLGDYPQNHSVKPNSGSESNNLSGKKMIQILLVAVAKNQIERCEKSIKNVGLKLKSIEVENFSLVRSLIGNDQGNFVIAEIGSIVCNIILVEKGTIKSSRNVDAGGGDITKIISRSLQIDEKRVEQMKISGENFFSANLGINLPALEIIIGEIKKMLYNYYKSEDTSRINGIILSGGTAKLKGIEDYFFNALKIKTFVGNPFSRISYNQKLEPILNKNKTRFSVALGLALRGAEEYQNR